MNAPTRPAEAAAMGPAHRQQRFLCHARKGRDHIKPQRHQRIGKRARLRRAREDENAFMWHGR